MGKRLTRTNKKMQFHRVGEVRGQEYCLSFNLLFNDGAVQYPIIENVGVYKNSGPGKNDFHRTSNIVMNLARFNAPTIVQNGHLSSWGIDEDMTKWEFAEMLWDALKDFRVMMSEFVNDYKSLRIYTPVIKEFIEDADADLVTPRIPYRFHDILRKHRKE